METKKKWFFNTEREGFSRPENEPETPRAFEGGSITTFTGVSVDVRAVRGAQIHIRDVAHALSLLCRANGHFKSFFSVAQHSVNCCLEARARKLSKRVALACLLHDASEAYISDVTSPVKRGLPDYEALEADVQRKIFEKFGLGGLTEKERAQIDEIDRAMLLFEFERLHPCGAWEKVPALLSAPSAEFRSFAEAETVFLRLFDELQ
jgi:hypothetical protein